MSDHAVNGRDSSGISCTVSLHRLPVWNNMEPCVMASSYLDEYRRKFGTIGVVEQRKHQKSVSTDSDDIQKLLSKYLGDERKLCKPSNVAVTGFDADSPADSISRTSTLQTRADTISPTLETQLLESLLPTGDEPAQRHSSLTVNNILESDSSLSAIRENRPSESQNSLSLTMEYVKPAYDKKLRRPRSFNNSFKKPIQEALLDQTEHNELLRTSHMLDKKYSDRIRLRRSSSTQSNRSEKSADLSTEGSDAAFSSALIEDAALSDDCSDFDSDIELNDSNLNDSDSQRLLSRFNLDNDSQIDADSLASYEEGLLCALCSLSSPRLSGSVELVTCVKCMKRQTERKETIQELLDSEINYGKDLIILWTEFHDSLDSAELLSCEELAVIFGNLKELIAVNQKFIGQLQTHIADLLNQGDTSLSGAMIGKLVCEFSASFLAFEKYCMNYADSSTLIEQLKKDRELFALFLSVSQDDNALLRRMDLKSFLMIPVQRIMKYPLLLKRLHKCTNPHHSDKKSVEEAVEKLSNILHHINAQSKLIASLLSTGKTAGSSKPHTSFEIALMKLTMDAVKWKHSEIHFVISGKIGYLQSSDNQWSEKVRNLRFTPAYAVLITQGKETFTQKAMVFPKSTVIKEAVLLIIKKGNSKLFLLREPFYLNNCVISKNVEFHDVFEVQENVRESIVVRPVHASETWYQSLKYYSMVLGGRNQRRRNAAANIVLHNK